MGRECGCVKFVDDTTTVSVSNDPHNCLLQKAADHLVSWTDVNGMVINTSKTQEMVVYFGKQLCVDDIPFVSVLTADTLRELCHLNCLV